MRARVLTITLGVSACIASPVLAQAPPSIPPPSSLEEEVHRLERLVDAQQRQLERQQQQIDDQAHQLGAAIVATAPDARLAQILGRGEPASAGAAPSGPVGQPSPEPAKPLAVAAVPVEAGVLTPRGHFTVEVDADFERYSSNRLVFQGVEIIPGLQLGVIQANSASVNSYIATGVVRYGILNRLEAEIRIPVLDTAERVTVTQQMNNTVVRTLNLRGEGLGDVEGTLRYQFNKGSQSLPIFLGSFRVKSATGTDPYSVRYDSFGDALSLPTGSGTWEFGPGLTILYPSDPVVLFGGLSYLDGFNTSVNKTIAGLHIGVVKPGYTAEGSVGFGLALNPQFSISSGLRYDYIEGTSVALNNTRQRSNSLQVGVALFSMAYRVNDRVSINLNSEFGVTSDAPDFRCVFRVPVLF